MDEQKESTPGGDNEEAKAPLAEPKTAKPPKRSLRRRWSKAIMALIVIALVGVAYVFRSRLAGIWQPPASNSETSERKILYWQDPMHPQYTSDKPGKAPDCGMDLVPVYAEETKPKSSGGERKILYWQDPMDPQHKSDKPGKSSDGMDFVPVYAEEESTASQPPEGAFKISPEKQQLIGMQYGDVKLQTLTKTIRAVARLSYDETRIVRIHSKIEGWIERLYVDFTGQLVNKNQPLLTVYSPELVATQEEYLLALRARDKLGNSSFKDVADGANSLVEAARRRLELWDISEQQIAEVEKTKKPVKAMTIFSPASGFVLARNAYERQRITPETELYSIADLSTVWAIADFYEYEISDVQLGQPVVLTVTSFPGRSFRGKVTYIYPQLNDTTRTLKVRAEFPNRDFMLKPDMYANAELRIDYGRRLAIPQEAVLDSGTEQLVFVSRDNGYFESRKVQLGPRVDNLVIVIAGLEAGERVVTSGNFLVDSESGLKAATSGLGMPGMSHGGSSKEQPKPNGTESKASPVGNMETPQSKPMENPQDQKKPEQHKHD